MSTDTPHGATPSGCDACPLTPDERAPSRREFLRRVASVAALGIGTDLPALMATCIVPLAPHGNSAERRYPIPATDGVSIDRDASVIIARAAGHVYAFSLSCPHQNTALRWDAGEHEFRCPKHKSRYRAEGTFIDGRATRSMDRLPIRREGDAIVVDVDTLIQQDERAADWSAAVVTL